MRAQDLVREREVTFGFGVAGSVAFTVTIWVFGSNGFSMVTGGTRALR